MIKFIDHNKMGRSRLGWLDSHFHFSFAEYYNPDNIQFGILRVINDDLIEPHTGFDTHPHRDMEIQYMSAGTGVTHSEHNRGDALLRMLQIWILPDKKNHTPNYGDFRFTWADREDKWLHMVTGVDSPYKEAPIQIHADMNIYAASIEQGGNLAFPVEQGRQAYLVLIEGAAEINGQELQSRDALEITEERIEIIASSAAHVILLEMEKDEV